MPENGANSSSPHKIGCDGVGFKVSGGAPEIEVFVVDVFEFSEFVLNPDVFEFSEFVLNPGVEDGRTCSWVLLEFLASSAGVGNWRVLGMVGRGAF